MWKTCRKISLYLTVILGGLAVAATAARAADFAVIVKSGTVQLWDDDQRLDLVDRHFDDNSRRTLAVAWEVRNAKEVALGMEYMTFRHDFSPPVNGHTKTQVWMFNAKKYFSPNRVLHPFIGIGLGWGHVKYDDGQGNVDRDVNVALQATGGVEFRIGENFGLYTEVKGLASNTDGEEANQFDFSGTGFMAGISLIF
jgi:opacity protein-like surface antigen